MLVKPLSMVKEPHWTREELQKGAEEPQKVMDPEKKMKELASVEKK